MKTTTLLVALICATVQSVGALPMSDGVPERWDRRFGKLGIHGIVSAIAADGQGNLYIGGEFQLVNDGLGNRIVRHTVKWDGQRFHPVGGGVNGPVHAIAIDDHGTVYVGGAFARAYQDDVNSTPANNIARWDGAFWHPLGQYDSRSNGVNRSVEDIHILDGTVYLAGQFTRANQPDGSSLTVNYITGWNGHSWLALDSGMDAPVLTLTSRDTILYAGGGFARAGSAHASAIARWDGSAWAPVAVDPGPGVTVQALVFGPDDHLYAGGSFLMIGGQFAFHIARWNGVQWAPLETGIESTLGIVHALSADSTYVYAGGTFFQHIGALTVNHVARWDGARWSSMQTGVQGGQVGLDIGFVKTLAVVQEEVYAGGMFSIAGEVSAKGIARWDGDAWAPLGQGGNFGLNFMVDAVGIADHGVYVGGSFSTAGNQRIAHLARWDGSDWHEVGLGVTNSVYAITVHDERVYVGGIFLRAGGIQVNRIARWDGVAWHALGGGVNGRVRAIAADDHGNVYVGGEFTRATNPDQTTVNAAHVAKWDGERWHALGQGTSDHVYALAVHADKLYAGGRFRQASGHTVNFVAAWNGRDWHDLAGGTDLTVTSLAVTPSGSLYAGGAFFSAGGTTAHKIARWDGQRWHDVDGGFDGPMISALAYDATHHVLYAGGWFENAGNVTTSSIAKLERGRWAPMNRGVIMVDGPGIVHAIAAKDNRVYVGGTFLEAGGRPADHFSAWTNVDSGLFDLLTFTQAPGNGMAVATGSQIMIEWQHAPVVQDVILEIRDAYSRLNPWEELAMLPAATRQYLLSFTAQEYGAVVLRITDAQSPDIYHVSGPFSVSTPEDLSTRLRIPYDYGAYRLYHRNIDGWSFRNSSENLWPFDDPFPDWDTFCAALTHDFCYNRVNLPRLSALTIWKTMQLWGWQGSCSGFAINSLLFFNEHLFVPAEFPGHQYLHDVPLGTNARNMINATQVRFLLPVATDFFKHFADTWNNTPIEALEALEASLDQYRDHLALVLMDPGSKKSVHTIQPFRIERSPTRAILHCYDSNHPHRPYYHRTTRLTINLDTNTWSYQYSPYNVTNATSGLFTSPDLQYFMERPDVLRKIPVSAAERVLAAQNPVSTADDESESWIFVYPDPGSEVIIENPAGDQLGRRAGADLIHTIPRSVPILPSITDEEPDLPLGYFLPADAYQISQRPSADSPSSLAIFGEDAFYTYRNLAPAAGHDDHILLQDGLSVMHTGPTPVPVTVEALVWDPSGEKQFTVSNIGIAAGDSLHFTIDQERVLQFLNTGTARTYRLEVVFLPEDQAAGTVLYRDIAIAANTRHRLLPAWDELAVKPLNIQIDGNLDGVFEDSLRVVGEYVTGVFGELDDAAAVPADYALFQNYPNPFNESTVIRFQVPEPAHVRLDIFNVLGQPVTRIHDSLVQAGVHEVIFDAADLPSGVYIYRLRAGNTMQSRRLMLLR